MVFRLTLHAVIAGRVVDEDGEPLAGAQVRCHRRAYVNGRSTLMPQGYATTDDRGDYRAYGLPPGKYYVTAAYRMNPTWGPAEIRNDDAANETYATTYYPSALSEANAVPVEVTMGAGVTAIDLKLLRMRAVQLSGVVVGSPSSAPAYIMMFPRGNNGSGWENMRQALTDTKGAFIFRGVTPGTYLLQANIMGPSPQSAAATTIVEVGDSNVDGVQLTFGSSTVLKGNVVMEGKQELTDLKGRQVQIAIQPVDSLYGPGGAGDALKEDGTFELRNLGADRYRVNAWGIPDTYFVKAVRFGPAELPKEILDFSKGVSAGELTIVLSPNGAQIEGTVHDKDHKPVSGAMVAAVPEQRDYSARYKTGASDQYGRFVLKGLAPGKYKLFAFDEIEWGAHEDPEFMKPYEDRGETTDVKEGAKESKDLMQIVTDDAAAPTPKSN